MEHLTLETFQKEIMNLDSDEFQGELPVIIDFYAEWCGPCKALTPTLEELSKEYEGKLKVYKIDTEDQQEISSKFKIRSIPSVLFLSKKSQPQMKVGVLPKTKYKEIIEEILL
jgi:thioredoxin